MPSAMTTRQCHRLHGRRSRRAGMFVAMGCFAACMGPGRAATVPVVGRAGTPAAAGLDRMTTANPTTSLVAPREDVDARPIAHRIAWLAMSAAIVLGMSTGFGALVFFTLR